MSTFLYRQMTQKHATIAWYPPLRHSGLALLTRQPPCLCGHASPLPRPIRIMAAAATQVLLGQVSRYYEKII